MRHDALRRFLPTRRPFGRLSNDTLRVLVFALTDRCRDSVDIEVVCPAEVLSDPVQLVNDEVLAFDCELPSGSGWRRFERHAHGVRIRDREVEPFETEHVAGAVFHQHDFIAGFLQTYCCDRSVNHTVSVLPSLS